MGKYKNLMKNIGILTISNFGSKFLAFFLVPIYTSVLTTSEYGNFDYINVTISLLVPLLTLNISESALRFLLDKNNSANKGKIVGITFKYCTYSILIVILLCILNKYLIFSSVINQYTIYFILFYLSNLIYQVMQNIVRGYDKLAKIAVAGIINSILMLSLNIIFLLCIKMGIHGFFLANIISMVVSSLYLMIGIDYGNISGKDKQLEKSMTSYSKPLMFNSLGWWINNVSDRYFVTYMCGIAENGIYSIAYKIPSLLSIFQTIFNQAWIISSVKNIESKNNEYFINNVYNIYNIAMVLICSLLIMSSKILAKFLYLNEFYNAWKYMPFLLISIVFGALSGVIGGVFTATKDTKILGSTTFLGAIINIILNYLLIIVFGTMGAAISTMISYFAVWMFRYISLKKITSIRIRIFRDLVTYFILLLQGIILLLGCKYELILEILCVLFITILNIDTIKKVSKMVIRKEID